MKYFHIKSTFITKKNIIHIDIVSEWNKFYFQRSNIITALKYGPVSIRVSPNKLDELIQKYNYHVYY